MFFHEEETNNMCYYPWTSEYSSILEILKLKKIIVHQNELSVLLKWDSKIINIVSLGLVSKRHAFEVKHLGMLVTSMNMPYSMGKTFATWPLH